MRLAGPSRLTSARAFPPPQIHPSRQIHHFPPLSCPTCDLFLSSQVNSALSPRLTSTTRVQFLSLRALSPYHHRRLPLLSLLPPCPAPCVPRCLRVNPPWIAALCATSWCCLLSLLLRARCRIRTADYRAPLFPFLFTLCNCLPSILPFVPVACGWDC